jgi:hypothetical protein
MTSGCFHLSLAFPGHVAFLLVKPVGAGGYTATAEVDGRSIARRACSDWRRVERFRARMQVALLNPRGVSATSVGSAGPTVGVEQERL